MKCDDCGRMIMVNARYFVETEGLDTMVYCLSCAEKYAEEGEENGEIGQGDKEN